MTMVFSSSGEIFPAVTASWRIEAQPVKGEKCKSEEDVAGIEKADALLKPRT